MAQNEAATNAEIAALKETNAQQAKTNTNLQAKDAELETKYNSLKKTIDSLGDGGNLEVEAVGIESVVQTTTSTADNGVNVVTVTKTDGITSTFEVRNGSKGSKGDPGDGATHSWDGTVLTVTSASGTSSADLKGEKGDKGDAGSGYVYFSIAEDGILQCTYTGDEQPNYSINSDGYLILEL